MRISTLNSHSQIDMRIERCLRVLVKKSHINGDIERCLRVLVKNRTSMATAETVTRQREVWEADPTDANLRKIIITAFTSRDGIL